MKKTASLLFCILLTTAVMAQQEARYVIQDSRESSGLVMYPNPTADVIYIEHIRPVTEVIVFNLLGQVIDRFETNLNQNYILDLTELQNGMYFIRVTDELNNWYIQKVIKK
jgi:hypothetical protein